MTTAPAASTGSTLVVAAIDGEDGLFTGAFTTTYAAQAFIADYARTRAENINGYDEDFDYEALTDTEMIEVYFSGDGNLDGDTYIINLSTIDKAESTVLHSSDS